MSVQKSNLTDADELVALVNSAYRGESSKAGWTSEAHLLEGTRIDSETMLQDLQKPNVDVLKYVDDNNAIKGCVYLEVKQDLVYLGMLTVSPNEQDKGIGRILLNAAENHCREKKCNGLQITVITTRHELIDWYKRRGFYDTGERRDFPVAAKFGIAKAPIELLVMNKNLN